MNAPGAGVLLALSGDDADILRVLSQPGSGLCVVRRCADLPELLSAGMAGLASFAMLDTGFDEIDRTVLDRLTRAGLSGLLLVEAHEEERWRSAGWPTLRRDAAPGRICSAMQDLVRRNLADAEAPGSAADTSAGRATAPGAAGAAVPEASVGPAATRDDWLGAATPAEAESGSATAQAAQETAWLEELWRQSPHPQAGATSPAPPEPRSVGDASGALVGGAPGRITAPAATSADGVRQGRIILVWGPHGAPGRSTVAASLAHGLAGSGGAILVDADVEAPSLVQLLGMPEDSSALAGAARLATHGRLDAESFGRLLAPVGEGLSLLGGLGRAGRWRELPPASMTEVWLQCRRAAAWTVVDVAGGAIDDDVDDFTLEPGRGAVTADLVSSADLVLVVGGADPVGVRRLLQLLDEVGSSVTPTGRLEVVVNRVRASAAGPSPQQALREALSRFGGLEDIVLLPDDPATADACLLQGRSVLEGAPASALGKALIALVDRLDPVTAAARKDRSSRRTLLGRRRRDSAPGGQRGVKGESAERKTAAKGRSRSATRSRRARRRKGERVSAPRTESRAESRAESRTERSGPQGAAPAPPPSPAAAPPSIPPSVPPLTPPSSPPPSSPQGPPRAASDPGPSSFGNVGDVGDGG